MLTERVNTIFGLSPARSSLRKVISGILISIALVDLVFSLGAFHLTNIYPYDGSIKNPWPVPFQTADSIENITLLFPEQFLLNSHPLETTVSVIMLLVAYNLAKGKRLAWYAGVATLVLSIVLHLVSKPGMGQLMVVLYGLTLAILLADRKSFAIKGRASFGYYSNSFPSAISIVWRELAYIAVIYVGIFVLAGLAFYMHGKIFSPNIGSIPESFRLSALSAVMWDTTESYSPHTQRADLLILSITLGYASIYGYLANLIFTWFYHKNRSKGTNHIEIMGDEPQKSQSASLLISKILGRYGDESISCFASYSDKQIFIDSERKSFIPFRPINNGVALALGGPVGPESNSSRAISEFVEYCTSSNISPAFYNVSQSKLAMFEKSSHNLVRKRIKIGEEAIISPLSSFSLSGSRMKNLRNSMAAARRAGITIEIYDFAEAVKIPMHTASKQSRIDGCEVTSRTGIEDSTNNITIPLSMNELGSLLCKLQVIEQRWESDGRRNLGFSCSRFSLEENHKGQDVSGINCAICNGYHSQIKHLPEMFRDSILVVAYTKEKEIGSERTASCFLTVKLYPNGNGAVLDLIRRSRDSPLGAVEYMLDASISYIKKSRPKITEFSLGLVALAQSEEQQTNNKEGTRADTNGSASSTAALLTVNDADNNRQELSTVQSLSSLGEQNLYEKIGFAFARKTNLLYKYNSLFKFKDKFNPRWEPRFVVMTQIHPLNIARVGYAIFKAHSTP